MTAKKRAAGCELHNRASPLSVWSFDPWSRAPAPKEGLDTISNQQGRLVAWLGLLFALNRHYMSGDGCRCTVWCATLPEQGPA